MHRDRRQLRQSQVLIIPDSGDCWRFVSDDLSRSRSRVQHIWSSGLFGTLHYQHITIIHPFKPFLYFCFGDSLASFDFSYLALLYTVCMSTGTSIWRAFFFFLYFFNKVLCDGLPLFIYFFNFFFFFWNFVFLFSCSSLLNPFAQCLLYVYKFGPIERNIKTVQWIHNFLLVSTQGNKTPLPTTLIKSQYLFLAIMFDAGYATQLSDSSTRSKKIIPRAL
jgi:hypothetical protein